MRKLDRHSMIVVLGLTVAGCSTVKLPPSQPSPVAAYPLAQETDGLIVAVHPMTNRVEVARLFGADFLAPNLKTNILPVLVVATNQSASSSFLISREQFRLLNGSANLVGGQVREGMPRSDSVLPGVAQGLGFVIMPLSPLATIVLGIPSAIASHQESNRDAINQHLRHEELLRTTLAPGAATHGYLYFPVRKTAETRPDWTLIFKARTLQSEVEKEVRFAFGW